MADGGGLAASIRLPYPPYLWKVIRRSALLWVMARLLYSVVLWLATRGDLTVALHPSTITRLLLVATAAFFVWADRRRSHELLLPANLGASSGWFWTSSLLAASMLDVGVQTVLAAL